MKARKTWREKMENPNLPKVVPIPEKMAKRWGRGNMLLPSPHDVEAAVRGVRTGNLTTISELRQFLAAKYSVDTACPLVTGIFVRIVAEVAEEDRTAGKSKISPYWRVVREDGGLNPKFPGGVRRQAELLRHEGHRILPAKGKQPPRVSGYSIQPPPSTRSAS